MSSSHMMAASLASRWGSRRTARVAANVTALFRPPKGRRLESARVQIAAGAELYYFRENSWLRFNRPDGDGPPGRGGLSLTPVRSASGAESELEGPARRRIRITAAVAALIAALAVAISGEAPRRALGDVMQRAQPAPPVSRQVHVVVVDADSLRALGGWPW